MNSTFEVRKALLSDKEKIFSLYKKVATLPEGIARNVKEITPGYIDHFMQNAAVNGVEFVIENPNDDTELIAEIHSYKWGIAKFNHVFSELTIVVSPAYHGQGLGKLIFTHLLHYIETERRDILRVELAAQESNEKAIRFYRNLGFVQEGRFEKRIKTGDSTYEADIPMAWFNKNFGK